MWKRVGWLAGGLVLAFLVGVGWEAGRQVPSGMVDDLPDRGPGTIWLVGILALWVIVAVWAFLAGDKPADSPDERYPVDPDDDEP